MKIIENLSMYELTGVLILSLVPTILLLSIILISDRNSREPLPLLLVCIFSGVFTISFSLVAGKILLPHINIFKDTVLSLESFSIFKIAFLAMIEEMAKLFILYVFMAHNREFDDIYDGFVYSSLISLSFACMETVLYVFNENSYADMTSLAVLRNISSIPLHLVCGIVMGYYVAIERFSKTNFQKIRKITKALLIPTIIHAVYNCFFSLSIMNLKTKPYGIFVIIGFLLIIYLIGGTALRKIVELNKVFMKNEEYPKAYSFLMTRNMFLEKRKMKESKNKTLDEIIYDTDDDFTPANVGAKI